MNQPPAVDPEASRRRAIDQLLHNMTNHTPAVKSIERIEYVRAMAKSVGIAFIDNCPQSRELSLAITNLEDALMWAVAAIARAPQ